MKETVYLLKTRAADSASAYPKTVAVALTKAAADDWKERNKRDYMTTAEVYEIPIYRAGNKQ